MNKSNLSIRKTRRIFRKRALRQRWEKQENIRRHNLPKATKRRRPRASGRTAYRNSYKIVIPKDFTLRTNVEGVMEVVHQCRAIKSKKIKYVIIDFRNVEKVAPGALTILLSNIMDFSDGKISVGGLRPKNRNAKRQMERSGFFQRLNVAVSLENVDTPNAILEKGSNHTEQEKTAPLIRKAMKTVWGIEKKNTRIQGMLVELMANTINHAFEKTRNKKGWYLSVDHEERNDSVAFCFLDNGEGILNTVNLKYSDRILQLLIKTNDIILAEAFNGYFGSRTKLTNRGKGLPAIKGVFEAGVIKELKIITNNVSLDFETGKAKILKRSFDGTFYYWVLNKNCI